jgi:4-amino-4-deoxy-L-arabinose transferase-like glycosyltransferase
MRTSTGWLLALLFTMAFAFQGTRAIWEPDEGRYTATALNMLESGDWLLPTLDGERPHLTKPPIVYWSIAASITAFGRNEWAARLPGALAFVVTGLCVFGIGRRMMPNRPWLPAAIWATCLAPFIGSNIVSTDALLMCFEAVAMYAFVEAWSLDGAARRRWILAMWLAWGLAFMTKGPPGLLPLLAMVVFLAAHDRPRLRGLFAPVGLLLFAVVAFTWFGLIVYQQPDRLGYFLGYEVYDRVFTATHDRNAQWYGGFRVYLPVLIVGALPWWAMALKAAGGPRAAWRRLREQVRERDRSLLLLAYWFGLPLAVFFLARSRLELYLIPLFAPLALLLARPLSRWAWLDDRRLARVAAITALVLLALKATAAYVPSNRDARVMADAIRHVVDMHGIEEIAFVGSRPFYGLTMYLDVHVEGISIGRNLEFATYHLTSETVCEEIAERENNMYALKRNRAAEFVATVHGCGNLTAREVGVFEADDNRFALFVVDLHG